MDDPSLYMYVYMYVYVYVSQCGLVPDAPTITLTSTPTSMKADIVSNSPDWNVMRYCVKAAAKATGDNQVILPSQLPANVPNCTDTDTIEIYNLEEFVLYTVSGWVLNGRGEAGTATIKDHKTLQAGKHVA